MDSFILLVTWFVSTQASPHSYQVGFGGMTACQLARDAVTGDAERLRNEQPKVPQTTAPGVVVYPPALPHYPRVSAICAARR